MSTHTSEALAALAIHFSQLALRAAGKGTVRRRLEVLVNTEVIGLEGAQRIYFETFGDRLVAIKADKVEART